MTSRLNAEIAEEYDASKPRPPELERSSVTATALLRETHDEMARQDEKWGWPRPAEFLETCPEVVFKLAEAEFTARQTLTERPSWDAILAEETGEAAREEDPDARVAELVQVAASALSWAQAIQERTS